RGAMAIEPLGTLWINAIRMTVISLVVGSLIVGITSAPNAPATARVARRAIVFFIVTLFLGAGYAALIAPLLIDRIPLDPAAVASMQASAKTASGRGGQSANKIPTFTTWIV